MHSKPKLPAGVRMSPKPSVPSVPTSTTPKTPKGK